MSIAAIGAGIASQIPVIRKFADKFINSRRQDGGTMSADYCYAVFMRHLWYAHKHGLTLPIYAMAELGPGRTIGVGIAALLSGVTNTYYALDVVDNKPDDNNLRLFRELLDRFREKWDIPDQQAYPKMSPKLDQYTFPSHILSAEHMQKALHPERVAKIEAALQGYSNAITVRYIAPWNDKHLIRPGGVDWILSQAVMEHVDDLTATYAAFAQWLKPNGLMTHEIDFKCHNTTRRWNGHWTIPNWQWKHLYRGQRSYLINREPLSTHVKLLNEYRFQLLETCNQERESAVRLHEIAPEFLKMTAVDLHTSSAFMVACLR